MGSRSSIPLVERAEVLIWMENFVSDSKTVIGEIIRVELSSQSAFMFLERSLVRADSTEAWSIGWLKNKVIEPSDGNSAPTGGLFSTSAGGSGCGVGVGETGGIVGGWVEEGGVVV
jgi:hypothetical protein